MERANTGKRNLNSQVPPTQFAILTQSTLQNLRACDKVAMASTAVPILKLVIQKGPRNGETLEFNSKSTVRIGRVVRGNNLPIKDAGISSKHLAIEFNSDSGKWVITDLESSNGTILNTSQLKPLTPFELRNGDEIKIGELTSIRVEIVETGGEIRHRRNPRRQAAPKGELDLGPKADERPNLGEGGSVTVRDLKGVDSAVNLGRGNRKGRGRDQSTKENVLADVNAKNVGNVGVDVNVEDSKPKQVREVGTRRTRNSKREGEEFLILIEPIPARRTRSMKNAEKVPEYKAVDVVNHKELENVSVVESKKTRGWGRKKKLGVECLDDLKDATLENMTTRETSQLQVPDVGEPPHDEPRVDTVQQHVSEGEMTGEVSQVEVQDVREQPHEVAACDTVQQYALEGMMTMEKSQLNVADISGQPHEKPMGDTVQQYVSEDKMTEKVSELEIEEQVGGVLDVKGQPGEQPMEDTARETDNAVGNSHYEQDTCRRLESDTVLQNGRVKKTEMGEVSEELGTDACGGDEVQEAGDVPDLGKMTLGEWFDYLQVCLPKQIHDVTNEIIVDMRKRAKQFDEFMLQQQKKEDLFRLASALSSFLFDVFFLWKPISLNDHVGVPLDILIINAYDNQPMQTPSPSWDSGDRSPNVTCEIFDILFHLLRQFHIFYIQFCPQRLDANFNCFSDLNLHTGFTLVVASSA
ncbi:hypothetical protein Cgig2_009175 [Carnegiea gigantea]|uniref:FHA domain-containing protein n=1 Tax=Carnegiea gigantea TaxID=171969 RepID=A0A9Q1KCS1_9CARY|nr:hypothetical protein Cgig2_009175 [Carnegiea gigantea]